MRCIITNMPGGSFKQTCKYLSGLAKKYPLWPSVVIALTAGLVGCWMYGRRDRVEGMTNGIEFIDQEVGRRLLKSDAYAFARSLRRRESLVRTGRPPDLALNTYLSGILEFSESERTTLTNFISNIRLLSDLKWRFLKMKSDLDWGYPYTFADVVVIPQHLVDGLVDSRKTGSLTSTLLHEYLHICQRREQSRFNEYYERNYNMRHTPELLIPQALDDTLVTNPDGLDVRWVFTTPPDEDGTVAQELKGDWFFCMQLDADLQIQKSAYRVLDKRVSERDRLSLNLFAKYFSGLSNCYHPNEIFSYLQTNKRLSNPKASCRICFLSTT